MRDAIDIWAVFDKELDYDTVRCWRTEIEAVLDRDKCDTLYTSVAPHQIIRVCEPKLTKQITIAVKMLELRDTLKRRYAERWPTVAAPYREMIAGAMEGSGEKNPLSAMIPLAKAMRAKGHHPTLLMAVAVEMADS